MARIAKRVFAGNLLRPLVVLMASLLYAVPVYSQTRANSMFIISYAHESAGNLRHGTLSMIDGIVRVTWTVDEHGRRTSRDSSMSEEAFRSVWAAVSELPEFGEPITDPNAQLDFRINHIVGIVFLDSGREVMRTFAIPAGSSSKAFKSWLASIRGTEK